MTKELKALEQLKYYNTIANDDFDMTKELKIIETALKELDFYKKRDKQWKQDVNKNINKLKALEIIKKKRVNLEYLKCCETYEQYKTICSYWNEITKEEYNLLKEELL